MVGFRIGVLGCAGRMGQALVRAVGSAPDADIAGGTEVEGSQWLGRDVGEPAGIGTTGVTITEDPEALFQASDVVLDFTAPAALAVHAKLAAATGKAMVIGTTGTTAEQDQAVLTAAKRAAIVRSANMSVGVNLLLALTRTAAAALDLNWDAEILEMHHRHKVDAPSGTAKALGHAIAEARGVVHDKVAVLSRAGVTGERRRGEIGYAALRGGMVVGEHTVIFASERERIELGHQASSRDVFAEGAVAAARWVHGKKPGLYGMSDVLGLND
jgi:4-hydroxy-tetrahydrodipicolinate reductase